MVTSSSKAYSFLATKSGDNYTLTTTEAVSASPKYLAAGALSETAANLTLSKGSKLGTLAISGFTGDYTFTVGSKPATSVDPSTTITPDIHLQSKLVQNAGDELILLVEGNFTAILTEDAAPYITNSNGQKVSVSGAVLTVKDASTNKFNVTTAGLSAGIYLLHLPKGTFVYKSTGGTVVDTEVSGLQFTIQNGSTKIRFTPRVSTDGTTWTNLAAAKDITKNKSQEYSFQNIPAGSMIQFFVQASTSSVSAYIDDIKISLPKDASGIDEARMAKNATSGNTYNLSGQRVDANFKGIVVKNGRKMINK
jgi:hypothetical protein